MTIDLPPRRVLPDHVKERMRPELTEAGAPPRSRRNLPFAVAAGVALLVAGGAIATNSANDQPVAPAAGRVLAPSRMDVDRCRAELSDPRCNSTSMVTFEATKVLVGDTASSAN